MNLTLEVVSSNGQALGSARRKVFGPNGGRIGRANDCEWVLANPYISRHHATVRCINNAYFIESTGENRVALHSPQAWIPPLRPSPIRSGDRLYLDEYEIVVTMERERFEPAAPMRPAAMPEIDDETFADLEPTRNSPAVLADLDPTQEEVDPLRRLSARPGALPPDPPPAAKASWNHTPGVNDQYSPPPVPEREPVIPENWDRTVFGRNKVVPEAPVAAPAEEVRRPSPSSREIPSNWAETSFGMPRGNPVAPAPPPQAPVSRGSPRADPERPIRQPPPPPVASPPPPVAPPRAQSPPVQASPVDARPPEAPAAPPRAAPRPAPPPAARAATAADSSSFDADAFFRAAGLDPSTIPAETAASLGEILRSVVQGVVEVLQARAEVKDQFRMAMTRIKTKENNPLKFAVNAENALRLLLGHPDPSYLAPVEAFEDAMNDIRFHQIAMLSGMRAGFDQVMRRFDPAQLQQLFDKRANRGGLLAMGAKSRYWEMYTQEFAELSADPEEAFRRVFGAEFASAYERQLNTLKRDQGKLVS